MSAIRTLSLVGSTGSIGRQTIEVVRASQGALQVKAIGAHSSVDALAEQAQELRPERVAVVDGEAAEKLRELVPAGTEVLQGPEALVEISQGAEVVVNAVVGFAGLPVTLAALEAGQRLALANKESLVAGGPVVQRARQTPGSELIPIDSEHCAIHQCLRAIGASDLKPGDPGAGGHPLRRLVLTASGGPFRGRTRAELEQVNIQDALAHPTWKMGPKITVDSSTLMNKGLEVIEAHELFGVDYDAIDVVVHPQSVVHSMIETVDGATLAQLSMPDMRLPIGYALSYPDRLIAPFGALDWASAPTLEFEVPDRASFQCLDLAYAAGRAGGTAPACVNGANEVAVDAFLSGRLRWVDIATVIEKVLESIVTHEPSCVEDVLDADAEGRRLARAEVDRLAGAS